jgi:hypothetical protein
MSGILDDEKAFSLTTEKEALAHDFSSIVRNRMLEGGMVVLRVISATTGKSLKLKKGTDVEPDWYEDLVGQKVLALPCTDGFCPLSMPHRKIRSESVKVLLSKEIRARQMEKLKNNCKKK